MRGYLDASQDYCKVLYYDCAAEHAQKVCLHFLKLDKAIDHSTNMKWIYKVTDLCSVQLWRFGHFCIPLANTCMTVCKDILGLDL